MENIFFGVLATVGILMIVFAIIHFSSKKAIPPTTSTTTSPGGLTDWVEWRKWKDKIAIPVALVLILGACWLVWPEKFTQVTTTPVFWAGFILVVIVSGALLSTSKEFEKRWDRKFLMTVSLLGGIALIIYAITPPGTATAIKSVVTPQPAHTQPQQRQMVVSIRPDRWTHGEFPIGCKGFGGWEAPGDVMFTFTSPKPDTIRVADGQWIPNLKFPSRTFTARGTAGDVIFSGLRYHQ